MPSHRPLHSFPTRRSSDLDPQLQALGVQLAEVAVRNTAGGIADKIRAVKARKENQETIAELEAIVNDLVADKSELVRIANAYEDRKSTRLNSSHRTISYAVSPTSPLFPYTTLFRSGPPAPGAWRAACRSCCAKHSRRYRRQDSRRKGTERKPGNDR